MYSLEELAKAGFTVTIRWLPYKESFFIQIIDKEYYGDVEYAETIEKAAAILHSRNSDKCQK